MLYGRLHVWFGSEETALDLRFKRERGIIQGCSAGMLLLAMVMTVWAEKVQEEEDASLSVYADDGLIWSRGDDRVGKLEKACRITKEFDDSCKLKMNQGKGHVFSTANDDDALAKQLDFVGPKKEDFVYLGVDYTIRHEVGPRNRTFNISQARMEITPWQRDPKQPGTT